MAGMDEYLIDIGFKPDKESQKKFQEALERVHKQAEIVSEAVEHFAETIVDYVTEVTGTMSDLLFQADRLKITVTEIQAVGFAMKQAGLAGDDFTGVLTRFHTRLSHFPAYNTKLQQMGVQVRDAQGRQRASALILTDVAIAFSKKPRHQALAEAQDIGIMPNEFDVLLRPEFMKYYKEMLGRFKSMKADPHKAALAAERHRRRWVSFTETQRLQIAPLWARAARGMTKMLDLTEKVLRHAGPGMAVVIAYTVKALSNLIIYVVAPVLRWLVHFFQRVTHDYKLIKRTLSENLQIPDGLDAAYTNSKKFFEQMREASQNFFSIFATAGDNTRVFLTAIMQGTPWVRRIITGIAAMHAAAVRLISYITSSDTVRRIFNVLFPKSTQDYGSTWGGVSGGDDDAAGSGGGSDYGGGGGWGGGAGGSRGSVGARGFTRGGSGGGSGGSVGGARGERGVGGSRNIGGATVARQAEGMQYAMDQLRKEGVPEGNLRAAAALLVGQAIAESKLNPNASHDGGTGYGIYGARLDRWARMSQWLKANGYAPNSYEGQMRYMAHEAMSAGYKRTRAALMGASRENLNAGQRTLIQDFERPADQSQNRLPDTISAFESVERAARMEGAHNVMQATLGAAKAVRNFGPPSAMLGYGATYDQRWSKPIQSSTVNAKTEIMIGGPESPSQKPGPFGSLRMPTTQRNSNGAAF